MSVTAFPICKKEKRNKLKKIIFFIKAPSLKKINYRLFKNFSIHDFFANLKLLL